MYHSGSSADRIPPSRWLLRLALLTLPTTGTVCLAADDSGAQRSWNGGIQPPAHLWVIARSEADSEKHDPGSTELLLDGALTWGVTRSTANLSTTLQQPSGTGGSTSGSASSTTTAGDHGPGADLRGLLRWGVGAWRPMAGLQIGTAAADASGYTGRDASLEALGGVTWDSGPDVSWQFLIGAGLSRAPWSLSGSIATTGQPVERYDSSGTASGPLVRCEAGPTWRIDDWRLGVLGGARWSRLSGTSTWTSSAGGFSGTDELRITALGLYAGVSVGRAW